MNPENRWVKKAENIPWLASEDCYVELFPGSTGRPAKPLRLALGSLIIQKQYDYSDWELIEQLTEDPHYQFFIGLPAYQQEPLFVPPILVEFRKRLTADILGEINEMILEYNYSDDHTSVGGNGDSENASTGGDVRRDNKETLMLDATCAPQHIASHSHRI